MHDQEPTVIPFGGHGYQGPVPMAPVPAEPVRTNRRAKGALILALFGGSFISAVLAVSALWQLNDRGEKGRGPAVAALVISCCTMVFIGVVFVRSQDPEPAPASGGLAGNAILDFGLSSGDCIREFDITGDMRDLPVVPCTEQHAAQVYAVFTLAETDFPDEERGETEARQRCGRWFERYADDGNKDMNIYFLAPPKVAWAATRTVTCVAGDPAGTRTGSLIS